MSHPYIDTKAGLSMLGGNQMIYLRLLRTYATGPLYQDSVAAVASGDSTASQTALHTLKGATGNLHFTALYEKSKDLELGIKETGTMPSDADMADLADIQAQTVAQIESILADPSQL